MSTDVRVHPKDAQHFLQRFPNGVLLREGPVDFNLASELMYLAVQGNTVMVMHGQLVHDPLRHNAETWRSIEFLQLHDAQELVPLRDYLTALIKAEVQP